MDLKFDYLSSKLSLVQESRLHEKDTGSSFVQVSLLNAQISYLKKHIENNKKDFAARMSLLRKIYKRKSLLLYVKNNCDTKAYNLLFSSIKKYEI